MIIFFDTKNIYYLPQYKPVIDALVQHGHDCYLVAYKDKNEVSMVEKHCHDISASLIWVDDEAGALQCYLDSKPNWIFFANQFSQLDLIHQVSKTAQLGHGVGPKPSYYTKSNTPMTVRFIEGFERLNIIKKMYPNDQFVQVGFSKLDPILNGEEKGIDLLSLGLNPDAKTILYAPTFNPSSIECFPDDWPSHFQDYNILIKAHAFSYSRKRYAAQRKKLQKWSQFSNTYVAQGEQLSLLPFMVHADVLLSEASSTLFEFAALGRPVVVCDFFHLKWFYRGPFKFRFNRRFKKDNVLFNDIGQHVDSYRLLRDAVDRQFENPQDFKQQRLDMTHKHVGQVDGKASERIVEFLEQ